MSSTYDNCWFHGAHVQIGSLRLAYEFGERPFVNYTRGFESLGDHHGGSPKHRRLMSAVLNITDSNELRRLHQ